MKIWAIMGEGDLSLLALVKSCHATQAGIYQNIQREEPSIGCFIEKHLYLESTVDYRHLLIRIKGFNIGMGNLKAKQLICTCNKNGL